MDSRIRLYEQESLLQAAGETIRPGGLALTHRLVEGCNLPPGAAVLDIGCGMGATVDYLAARFCAYGIDLSQKLLERGKNRYPDHTLLQSSSAAMPFADQSFAAIFGECSLSAMADPDWVLDECRRILQPGGKLAISDLYVRAPTGVDGLRSLPVVSCLQGAMTQEGLTSRLHQHGFEPVLWEDQTAALKAFTAQLLFAHHSVEQFWCSAFASASANLNQIRQIITQSKPGYFILIAQRR